MHMSVKLAMLRFEGFFLADVMHCSKLKPMCQSRCYISLLQEPVALDYGTLQEDGLQSKLIWECTVLPDSGIQVALSTQFH